jgi:SAM-dependent methyltransferase
MSRRTPEDPGISRAEMWDARHAARDPIESRHADPTLIETATSLAPGSALDLGAGDGRNAGWLAAHGWRVTAVDFSTVAVERGRALTAASGQDVTWLREDLLGWTPPAGAFDLVLLMFIHLPTAERRLVYARAAAAVAPGGTLLVVAHDRSNLVDGAGGPQDPEVLFTPAEIAGDLPPAFSVIRAATMRRPGAEAPAPIDAVLVARREPESTMTP